MITTNLTEVELEVQEKIRHAEHAMQKIIEPKTKHTAVIAERQRILGILAGIHKQFIREMDNTQKTDENKDILLILNAKVIAIEQAINEIEHSR